VLGYAEFTEDEHFNASAEETEMFCAYKGYDSGYETGEESDEEDMEEIQVDKKPRKQATALKGILQKPSGQDTSGENKSVTFDDCITVFEFVKEISEQKEKQAF
jgi:hypothetical protein